MRVRALPAVALPAIALGGAVLATGAFVWAVGPGAAGLVQSLANGREAWRLGHLHIEGVEGPHLGALRAARFTLQDEDGVWAEAHDVRLRWQPLNILFNRIDITAIEADEIDILRRPVLSAPKPAGFFQPNVDIGAMRVAHIHLAEPVFGREAQLRFAGALDMEDRDLSSLSLSFDRSDADTDHLSLRINAAENELLRAELRGDPGGVIAAALDASESAVRLSATALGDAEAGEAALSATIGEETLAAGAGAWNARAWRGQLTFNPAHAPVLADLAQRLGPSFSAQAEGVRGQSPRAFTFAARSENIALNAQGRLDARWRLEGQASVTAETPDVNRLAPEFDLPSRGARIDGALTLAGGRATFAGEGEVNGIEIAGGEVLADGRVNAEWGAVRGALDLDLALSSEGSPELQRLLANGRLAGHAYYHRQDERIEITRAALQSDALRVGAEGTVTDEAGNLSGRWRIANLSAASPEISGAAEGAWRMTRAADMPWRLQANGAGARFRATNPTLAQLIGASPRLDLDALVADGGLQVSRATLNGAKLRLGAAGRFAETLDMRLEGSMRGPIRLGAAEIAGSVDATGALTGPIAHPRIEAQARMQRLDVAGVAIDEPLLNFTYDGATNIGNVVALGRIAGREARAEAQIAATEHELRFTNIDAHALGLNAQGDAAFGDVGPALNIAFSGALQDMDSIMAGRAVGSLTLTPVRGGEPVLAFQADLERAMIGELRLSTAELSLEGPLNRLHAAASLRGQSGQSPLELNASGAIVAEGEATIATIDVRGRLNGDALATRTPARIEFADGRIEATASVIAGDGAAELSWRSEGDRFAAAARLERAELSPFAALAGHRLEGVMSGEVHLASAGEGLSGAADLSIDDARLPARMRAPLDVVIRADLQPNRITGSVNARSADGLDAAIEGSAPVETRARPLRIALAAGGEGSAAWRAQGPAASLWSLVGGLDQSLTGQMDGAGRIRFNAAELNGEGRLSLAGGSFEDKRAGLAFRDLDARLDFSEAGASRFTMSARDANGGRISGEGAASGVRDGRIDLQLTDIQILNREDMRARASGALAFVWSRQGASLSGNLNLNNAELILATEAEAIVPEIAVVEINRPGGDLPEERPRPVGPDPTLDLRLEAPGRVYTRGRGLNAEWSLDARVRGRVSAPLLFGEARLVRGEFNLAGRPFDLQRGRILLSGAVDNASIDLLAEREETDLTARVAVTGELMDPTITLSSTPALPEDEILPRILFGRAAEDLSPLEGAQLAASLAALAGGGAFDIAGMARAAIGLDRLDVRDGEGGVIVSGGRYLTRDVYLEVSRSGLGEAGTRLEWRVRPQLSLVTSFLANGDQRASVRWRHDY
ncbi:MAG: translocation/assembly module TamB domain-containing protein [Hyphomonadaceae bacterium]